MLRQIMVKAYDSINRCQLGEDSPAEILAGAEDALQKLRESRGKTECSRASDLAPSVLEMAEQRAQRWRETGKAAMGVESGIRHLDEYLNGFNPGLYLLGGGPGVGKTSLCLQFAI